MVNFYFNIFPNPPYIQSPIEDFFHFFHSKVFEGLIVNGVIFLVYDFTVENVKIKRARKR